MCSGADISLLEDCPQSEQIKQAGIGGTVFFTAVMACIAASYALYTVFDNAYIAIGFGLVWGLLIFNLDRFIVSTIRKRESKRNEWMQAAPRILLAVLIAVVISKPLELKIFEKEIDQVLLTEKNQLTLDNQKQIAEQFVPQKEQLLADINVLESKLTTREQEVNALYNTYIGEAEGTSGTKKLGKGPVYKEKREKHDAALVELQDLKKQTATKIQEKEAAISALESKQSEAVSSGQPIIDRYDGLMARIGALGKLPWLPSFFIFLLFLTIETIPILAKLLASPGIYDLRLEDREATQKAQSIHHKTANAHLAATHQSLNDKVYQDLKEDEALYAYKKEKATTLIQQQEDAFYRRQINQYGETSMKI